MATVRKNLGQAALAASTLTAVYTVPPGTSAVISTITVCNRSTLTTIRLSHAIAGAADTPAQYFVYDAPLDDNDTAHFTYGITLGAGDVIRAYANDATVSVNIWGEETS